MTTSDIAIDLQSVTKSYRLYSRPGYQVLDRVGLGMFIPGHEKPREFAAIDDVTLKIKRGERLGLVGRNGAGKTTLLKLLVGHIQPTSGSVNVQGSVHAMMKSDLGFHMGFTGRQNIVSSLAYNGLWGKAALDAIADIEDFTELGDYLDQPFSNYSLGMQSRLLFAVASAVSPDILIVDEMLGAGDGYFMAKSARRMERLIDKGCTMLLVSHNTQQVLQFCDRAVWMRSGKIYDEGSSRDIVNSYDVYIERETMLRHSGRPATDQTDQRGVEIESFSKDQFKETLSDGKKVYRWPGQEGVKIDSLSFIVDGEEVDKVKTGDAVRISFGLRLEKEGSYRCRYLITIWSRDGWRIARIENFHDVFSGKKGDVHTVHADLSPFLLGRGDYTCSFSIYDMGFSEGTVNARMSRFDVVAHCLDFNVVDNAEQESGFIISADWAFDINQMEKKVLNHG